MQNFGYHPFGNMVALKLNVKLLAHHRDMIAERFEHVQCWKIGKGLSRIEGAMPYDHVYAFRLMLEQMKLEHQAHVIQEKLDAMAPQVPSEPVNGPDFML